MAHGIPARLSPAAGRKFGVQVGLAFMVLGGVAYWRGHPTAATVLLSLGLALVAAGIIVPGHLGGVYRAWMGLALAISKVTTPIIMGVVYFLVVTPTGLLLRLFGHRPLIRPRGESYWVSREADSAGRGDLRRQF